MLRSERLHRKEIRAVKPDTMVEQERRVVGELEGRGAVHTVGAITAIGEGSHAPSLVSEVMLASLPKVPSRMVSSDGAEPHPSRRCPLWLYHLDYHLENTSHPLLMRPVLH